jgi:hypothetical protein
MVTRLNHSPSNATSIERSVEVVELGSESFSSDVGVQRMEQRLLHGSLEADSFISHISSADPIDRDGKPSMLYGFDVAHTYDRQISYYAEQAGIPESILKAVVISEAGGASTDDDILQGVKSKINLADQSVGITQIKVGKAWELIHGSRSYTDDDLKAFSNRLQSDPTLAIRAAALHIKESKIAFDAAILNGGYKVVANRELSDLAGKEISRQDYNMALLSSYNLGDSVLAAQTKEVSGREVSSVDIFVERSRHNYVTSVEARGRTQEFMLKELGLNKPTEKELQRAAGWLQCKRPFCSTPAALQVT